MISGWIWAIALKPFALAILFLLIVWPLVWLARRFIPEGRMKRTLFFSWRV